MIKDIFRFVNLGLLSLAVGMVLISGSSDAAQSQKRPGEYCCAKTNPGPGCATCCNKWGANTDKKNRCLHNCTKGNCISEKKK